MADYLEKFPPQVAAIALLLCLIIGIFKKAVPDKFKKYLTFAPFAGGCLLYALYALIFGDSGASGLDTLQKGLECGAVSTVFYMLYEQFVKNKTITCDIKEIKLLTVKNILRPLVNEEYLEETAARVTACVGECPQDLSRCLKLCGEALAGKTKPNASAIDIQAAIMLIMNTVKTMA